MIIMQNPVSQAHVLFLGAKAPLGLVSVKVNVKPKKFQIAIISYILLLLALCTWNSLFVTRYLLQVTCYLIPDTCYQIFVSCYLLPDNSYDIF